MARLQALKPIIGTIKATLGSLPPVERTAGAERDRYAPWRKLYKTARWRALRMKILKRDHFTCQWAGCGRVIGDTSQLVADHRRPHRGDEQLFWDEGNLWTLCKPCHDGPKARAEQRGGAFA